MAVDLSVREGWISASVLQRTKALLQRFNLPIASPGIAPDKFLSSMMRDKKTRSGTINLVCWRALARPNGELTKLSW